ncbi:MAG TPA: hypothetical protein V6D25_30455 [Leptolyngbyaceae cyanobacterium]
MININKLIINSVLAASVVGCGLFTVISKASAYRWEDTPCYLPGNKKWSNCIETKGDAFLKGQQGVLHTYTFPNGKKFYWFQGEDSQLCQWKNTYVRQDNQSNWFNVNVACEGDDNSIITFALPSGNTLF